ASAARRATAAMSAAFIASALEADLSVSGLIRSNFIAHCSFDCWHAPACPVRLAKAPQATQVSPRGPDQDEGEPCRFPARKVSFESRRWEWPLFRSAVSPRSGYPAARPP